MEEQVPVYPFTAVVGQDRVKLALIINVIDRESGGLLIRGKRGTAKSTLVRALSGLLPKINVVKGCRLACDPDHPQALCPNCRELLENTGVLPRETRKMNLVNLPLNATEEMVVGSLDINKALKGEGKCFDPGLLAQANRGLLYVDEVNLLEDHIVDILLDSAAMGVNMVEREGVSYAHQARFILIGTMNPEEGELRPQLEDRFGLCVEVEPELGTERRAEVIDRQLNFRKDSRGFIKRWSGPQETLMEGIARARELLPEVGVPAEIRNLIAQIVHRVGADGHRADLAMVNAARALAAFREERRVVKAHVEEVAALALHHRLDKGHRLESRVGFEELRAIVLEEVSGKKPASPPAVSLVEERERANKAVAPLHHTPQQKLPTEEQTKVEIPEPGRLIHIVEKGETQRGRRAPMTQNEKMGRYYRSTAVPLRGIKATANNVALDATLRAFAARVSDEEGENRSMSDEDLRFKVRKHKVGASIMFIVDGSASMGAHRRLEVSREAIYGLLIDAYQRRDKVGLAVFKNDSAELLLSPTSSIYLARRLLTNLTPGGTTPLSHGLLLGHQVLQRELKREPKPLPVMVLLSDGGANVALREESPFQEALALSSQIKESGIVSMVIEGSPPTGKPGAHPAAERIAEALGATYLPLSALEPEVVVEKVQASLSIAR